MCVFACERWTGRRLPFPAALQARQLAAATLFTDMRRSLRSPLSSSSAPLHLRLRLRIFFFSLLPLSHLRPAGSCRAWTRTAAAGAWCGCSPVVWVSRGDGEGRKEGRGERTGPTSHPSAAHADAARRRGARCAPLWRVRRATRVVVAVSQPPLLPLRSPSHQLDCDLLSALYVGACGVCVVLG